MPSEIPLYASVSATFVDDGNGGSIAQATLGPQVYGVDWVIDSMVTNTNSAQTIGTSELRVYQGAPSPSTDRGGSWSADNDTFTDDTINLRTLEFLTFVWTKGDVGSVATIIVRGTQKNKR